MEPREYVETVAALTRAASSLAAVDPADLPAALAADSVAALAQAVRVADNALALLTRRVHTSGIWTESGDRSAPAWVMRTTGASYAQARDHLDAAVVCEAHPEFSVGFQQGATAVAHLVHVHRALSGPGLVKAQRRAHFPAFAPALATAAAETDPATYGRVLKEWTDAVDHAPAGRDAEALAHRYLVFSELGDQCLFEGALPLAEGRLLKRRLTALVDSHHRAPRSSALAALHARRAGPVPPAPEPVGGYDTGADGQARRDETPRGDEGLTAGEEFTPRSALMLDALLLLADLADAGGGVPLLDGLPPQVMVIVPVERLTRRQTGTAPPGTAPPPPLVPPALLASGGDPVPVSDATAAWASCGDAEIRRLLLDPDGVVTDLGRAVRVAGRDLRLRAALRDRYCRHPGCRIPSLHCQLHHMTHWADGGRTRLDDMYCYCPHHHRQHHLDHARGLLRVTGSPSGALHFWNGAVHLGTTRPQPLHRLPRPADADEVGGT